MASDAKSTVAEAVRQGCRQLDGYLEEIVAQARSEIHEMVAEMVRYQTLLVPPVSAVPVQLLVAPDNEEQIRQHCDQALEDLEPRVKARIEKVLLEEIQRAQQLIRDERDEILETLQNLSQVSMTSSRHR